MQTLQRFSLKRRRCRAVGRVLGLGLVAAISLAAMVQRGKASSSSSATVASMKKTNRDWHALSEKEWEDIELGLRAGDEEEELLEAKQHEFHEMEAARSIAQKAAEKLKPGDERARHIGPTMLFAITESGLDLDEESAQWVDMLAFGGTAVKCYVLDAATVLVTLQHGWEAPDVRRFLLDRPRVKSVTWDDVEYLPDGTSRRSERGGGADKADTEMPKSKRTKRRKKKKKKKGKKMKTRTIAEEL